MVGELHRRGFQRIRISPAMSPSGLHWRCLIAAIALFSPDHGAKVTSEPDEYPRIQGDGFDLKLPRLERPDRPNVVD
jgi:hypothetical protein